VEVTVNDSIAGIAPEAWNALAGNAWPFLKHEFLLAAETSGSVTPDAGWAPRHLAIYDGDSLRAAMPLYQKDHSWGEFVFDWAWARAYEQAGLPYYPKLVSAVPFTPASSRRLLLADPDDTDGAIALVHGAVTLANQTNCSSLHLLFPAPGEVELLREAGLHIRKDCQFHWHNDGYANFDEFLATFNSAKRKKARRDRRKVQEAGIRFRRLRGADLTAEIWDEVYRLISITFMRRGSLPYFTLDFFRKISAALPDGILVVLAEKDDTPVAAAVFFVGEQVLYGRYWGSDGHYDALHFETCYHQGIEYCIDNGLRLFEPGTQGEHKVARGFVPTATWSAHWLNHPEFFAVIGDYLERERQHVERYMDAVDERSPYKSRDPT
jgi:predicted N-acyltransferase